MTALHPVDLMTALAPLDPMTALHPVDLMTALHPVDPMTVDPATPVPNACIHCPRMLSAKDSAVVIPEQLELRAVNTASVMGAVLVAQHAVIG